MDAIINGMNSFERNVTKLDKSLFQYEKEGDVAYLRFDKDEVSKKIGEIAYYAVSSKATNSSSKYGAPWAYFEVSALRDYGYEDFYSIDMGVDYRVYTWDDGVLFLYNKNKEVIGYVDYSGGLDIKK